MDLKHAQSLVYRKEILPKITDLLCPMLWNCKPNTDAHRKSISRLISNVKQQSSACLIKLSISGPTRTHHLFSYIPY